MIRLYRTPFSTFLKYAAWRDPADDELFHRVLESYQRLGDDHPRLKGWIERIDERPRVGFPAVSRSGGSSSSSLGTGDTRGVGSRPWTPIWPW